MARPRLSKEEKKKRLTEKLLKTAQTKRLKKLQKLMDQGCMLFISRCAKCHHVVLAGPQDED